jgi:hypothetical protein
MPFMQGDYFDLGNFGQMGPTPPFVPGERTPGTDDAYSGEERSLEDIQAHRRRRPSITDEKYKPGLGRRLAAAAANAATTYVNMGGRTRVPDEPVQRLTGELLAPGYSRDITEWEDQGSALSDDYEIASRRGDIGRQRTADERQAERDRLYGEQVGAQATADRARADRETAQAEAIMSPGPPTDKWGSAGGGQIYNQGTGEFRAPESDPDALPEREKLQIQHTNRMKEIEARKAVTGGGPDPKVLIDVERDRSDRLMRAEARGRRRRHYARGDGGR